MAESGPQAEETSRQERMLRDSGVLLEYLGQKADSRLQAHFDDTRPQLAAPITRLAAPPCRNYKHLLNRLTKVLAREKTIPAPRNVPTEGDEDLDDIGFLCYARDFLAAVAFPATVETILVTKAYMEARRYPKFWRGLCGNQLKPSVGSDQALTFGAGRLAKRVVRSEHLSCMTLLVVVLVSTYAFAGRSILDSQKQIFADYQSIGRDLESFIKDTRPLKGDASLQIDFPPSGCDPNYSDPPVRTQIASAAPVGRTNRVVQDVLRMDPRLCAIYWRAKRSRQDITTVTLHLNSWSSFPLSVLHIGYAFGVNDRVIARVAQHESELCKYAQLDDQTGNCGDALKELVYQATEVAESLLHALTLYVLPTLYGCLGALMASLRDVRRKVELSVLSQTDRGRLRQDVILGTLCGAVMALFTGYFGNGTATEGLGLSALALLAAYNVPGVFGFLDNLSTRVFQSQRPTAASS